jgi:hypothetical protein
MGAPLNTSEGNPFHFVIAGWEEDIIQGVSRRIAANLQDRVSHIMHPRFAERRFENRHGLQGLHFMRREWREPMPAADDALLASLEREPGVPTFHNMLLGDPVVGRLPYDDARRFATWLAVRYRELFSQLRPSVVIGSYDGVHGGIGMAVARQMGLRWVAPYFSVIPAGHACFVDRMSPGARIQMHEVDHQAALRLAEETLAEFEKRRLRVPVYVPPALPSVTALLGMLPQKISRVVATVKRGRDREHLKYFEGRTDHDLGAVIGQMRHVRGARAAAGEIANRREPPTVPYAYFGLHMQPESSIDVWAPFYSNQLAVVESLARAMPPSHRLMVKIHKSDLGRFTRAQLLQLRELPGVDLVHPLADSRAFVDGSSLTFTIQGTIGLESALLGKPVITMGESAIELFPNVSRIGELSGLPALVRRKLAETPPSREQLLEAFARYLHPFLPAAHNDWIFAKSDSEISGFVELFKVLKLHVQSGREVRIQP